MKLIRVGTAVVNQTPLDWKGNANHLLACIHDAREQGVSLLCLPELCITGYGCEDAFFVRDVQETALATLMQIVASTAGMVVCLGLPLLYQNALLNTACVVADTRILGFVAKQHLAGDGIHYEPRWFKSWPAGRRAAFVLGDTTVPLGDLDFDLGGVRIGFEICEDAWVANRPGAVLAQRGVDIILNPSASHFAFGKSAVRERLVLEGSRAFGVSYLYSNLLGNEAGRIIYDGGALIASAGTMLARGPRFSFADHLLTTADIDVDATRRRQSQSASFQPDFSDQATTVRSTFSFPHREPTSKYIVDAAWESSPRLKEEEFTRAVALGLFDYLRKSRSEGFVVSLSGGCDSSVVVTLCALMVELGVAELGLDGLVSRLPGAPRLSDVHDVRGLVGKLLTCVYQATANSTAITRNAAQVVAEAVGADFFQLDVDDLVRGYTTKVEALMKRELNWTNDDLALQNIQARTRAPGVWMVANLRNALLLATSNRSEAAVGYATMDGDTCGGLSPIGGVDKSFLREFLSWLETCGPNGLGPIPALGAVTAQRPTAELRPAEAEQSDEKDLMPYDILNAIESAAICDRQGPVEVYRQMCASFPELDHVQIAQWIERFFTLWCRNQWKRERYAPSFHLDDENLDPKTSCRFPILSSGFAHELAELWTHCRGENQPEDRRRSC